MTDFLRTLCLSMAMLLLAFVPAVRADGGGCCGTAVVAASAVDAAARGEGTAGPRCCCVTNCQCTPEAPTPACGCKVPAPKPLPGAPLGPNPSWPGMVPVPVVPVEASPHVPVASRLRAATASGLPNVLLPGRSRQEALSVWLL